jgi:3-oxoacyl-[acyl-carrier-protein] synthase-1
MHKRDVYVIADNVFTPLGKTTTENFANLKQGTSAVKQRRHGSQTCFAALFEDSAFVADSKYTKFEQLLIASVSDALKQSKLEPTDEKTVLIISSTKGNISLLEKEKNIPELRDRIALSTSAKNLAAQFGFVNQPVIISNACVSGVMAIIAGMRFLRTGQYENAVIVGADIISEFILSGFQSFQALSSNVCKPFDKSRDGLNLGEGAGTVVLSSNPKYKGNIKVLGGGVSNDANHISGPSRTGKELAYAIETAVKDAQVSGAGINFISAHGTATPYNDEMEANAISIVGLENVPLNSLKGYYGHTLGAAGLIESIISIQSMRGNFFLPTPGFEERGVTCPVNVCSKPLALSANVILKTASGFGGCNAAVVFGK